MIKFVIKLVVFVVIIAIVLSALIGLISKIFESFEDESGDGDVTDAKTLKNSDIFSFLVVGKDKVSSLADVIMLVSFDKSNERVCVLQVPRDTYAEYGNGNYYKINGALRTLGADGMCDFFENAMGIRLDGYISLDLEGFRNAVDAVGGVEITVEKDLKYSDPTQGLYINLSRGRQVLDGKKAEMLVRYRSGYARGDLDRLDVQKKFLAAMFIDMKSKVNILNIYDVADGVIPYLQTDMSIPELVSLAVSGIAVNDEDICFVTLPGEDAVSSISGASFYVMSAKDSAELIEEYFFVTDKGFDKNGLFLHEGIKKFKDIYNSNKEKEVFFINDLK